MSKARQVQKPNSYPERIPLTLKNDRDAIQVAIDSIGLIPTEQLKIMRIINTASLSEVMLSDAYKSELSERDDLELITESKPMTFDSNGNLTAF